MLSPEQSQLLEQWLPGFRIIEDRTWGINQTGVYRVEARGHHYTVKVGDQHNQHIGREITAHETVLGHPTLVSRVPAYVAGDRENRILVTTWITGQLIDHSERESDPEVLVQAGRFLRDLHDIHRGTDESLNRNLVKAAIKWLDKPHAIEPGKAQLASQLLQSYPSTPPDVVTSHGDYSGRNWLWTGEGLKVIDFGRYGNRPASHDFMRMFFRRWYDNPGEAQPFFEGYGTDPEEIDVEDWWYNVLREAVATACWAHVVGDGDFEELGLRFTTIALAKLTSPA